MDYLKQSTAVTVKLGPFVDADDGSTAETALTIQKADLRLSKNGGNMAAASADQGTSDAGAPHDELGVYDGTLDVTDTNTLGRLRVDIKKAGALPYWKEWTVLPANVYDSMVAGSDKLQVDAVEIEGQDATDALEALLANNPVVLDKYTRAQLYGLTEVTPAGGGNTLVTYMEDDGTTPAFDVTVSPASERIARNLY